MPKPGVSLDRALELAAKVGAPVTLIVAAVLAYSSLKESDATTAEKLNKLEAEVTRARSDHDVLIEVRQDVRAIRAQIELLTRQGSGQRFGRVE